MTHKDYFTHALSGLFVAVIAVGLAWMAAAAVSPDLYATIMGNGEVIKITLETALFVTIVNGGVGVVTGWLLYWRNKPRTWWIAIVSLVLLATAVEVFVYAESVSTAIWLNIFHLLAAATIVPSVAISLQDRDDRYPTLGAGLPHGLASR